MSNKNWIENSNVDAGQSDNLESPIIPNGSIWMIKKFKAVDIDYGDHKSSVYILRFGSDIMEFISLTGSTYEIDVKEEIIGNGVKKLNVQRINNSGFLKPLPFKITAYERQ